MNKVLAALLLVFAPAAFGQQIINGRVTFTDTVTFQRGTTLTQGGTVPAVCTLGQIFYRTGVTAGTNLYICTSTNTWTQVTGGSGGSGTVTVAASGNVTNTAIVTGAGTQVIQTPAPTATMDASGNISTPGGIQTGNASTATGYYEWLGLTSGGQGFTVSDIAGSAVLYIMPAAPSGTSQFLQDAGAATCPTLPAGAPSVCHQLAWTDAGGGGAKAFYQSYPAAICVSGVAGSGFNLPSANAPTPACINSGTSVVGVLQFTAATTQSIQGHLELPADWTGAIDLELATSSSDSTHAASVAVQTVCVGSAAYSNPTFNSAQTLSVTNAATSARTLTSQTGLTTTGCSAGNELFYKIAPTTTSFTGTFDLLTVRFIVRRSF